MQPILIIVLVVLLLSGDVATITAGRLDGALPHDGGTFSVSSPILARRIVQWPSWRHWAALAERCRPGVGYH